MSAAGLVAPPVSPGGDHARDRRRADARRDDRDRREGRELDPRYEEHLQPREHEDPGEPEPEVTQTLERASQDDEHRS